MSDVLTTINWFLFKNNCLLLLKENTGLAIPTGDILPFPISSFLEFPCDNNTICRAAELEVSIEESECLVMMDLRSTWGIISDTLYGRAGKASQLLYWDRHSRFCPACGAKTEQRTSNMKKCPICGYELYPVISAAILCLVRKDDQILLVHALNFRGPFHSLVAGFLDTSETLEECAVREVLEETGIKIKNVTYFGNQPWPYPSGLMVGFIADYESGEIRLQEEELNAAAFYSKENLPELPRKSSLARQMLDWWIAQP